MIRLSKLTDYGIIILRNLATDSEGERKSARDIAHETQLPVPTVSKLMKILTKKGFLESHRGVRGGYALAKPSKEISLAEIIEALEGPLAITDCHTEDSQCIQKSICPLRGHWKLINDAINGALEGINLNKMAKTTDQDLPTNQVQP